jgi:hypothetical protein
VWGDTVIPNSALEIIGSLKSLEQVSLSAGEQFGWRHSWLIDHNAMRRTLANLTGLRKMAFSRDSYTYPGLAGVESYYEALIPAEMDEALWESQHRDMILAEADKYVRILSKLEWLYFGQLPMQVTERDGESDRHSERCGEEKKAVILSIQRDSCYTLLKRIFGAGGSLF